MSRRAGAAAARPVTLPEYHHRQAAHARALHVLRDDPDDGSELGPELARPRTRGECVSGPRPCPWVSCRHHLYLDVHSETGSLTISSPAVDPLDMEHSCSLDVADGVGVPEDDQGVARGNEGEERNVTFRFAGELMNVSRERIRQVEVHALEKLRASGLDLSAAAGVSMRDQVMRLLDGRWQRIGAIAAAAGVADSSRPLRIALSNLVKTGRAQRRHSCAKNGPIEWRATPEGQFGPVDSAAVEVVLGALSREWRSVTEILAAANLSRASVWHTLRKLRASGRAEALYGAPGFAASFRLIERDTEASQKFVWISELGQGAK